MHAVTNLGGPRKRPAMRLIAAASCVATLGLFSAGCHHNDSQNVAPTGVDLPPAASQAAVGAAGTPSPSSQSYPTGQPQSGGYAPPPAQGTASAPMAPGGRYQTQGSRPVNGAQPQSSAAYAPPAQSQAQSAAQRQPGAATGLTPQQLAAKRAGLTAPQPEHPNYVPPPYKPDPSDYAPPPAH